MKRVQGTVRNRLLAGLSPEDRKLIDSKLDVIVFNKGDVLFEPGQSVVHAFFPGTGAIASLMLNLQDGAGAEAAMVGHEGAIGGIISNGHKPAFTRGIVQLPGLALRLSTDDLDDAKTRSPSLRDHFARYADCLLAQVLQSVACNAVHNVEQRLVRWLLTTHDRTATDELHVTQELIAEMIGVQRTYVTQAIGHLTKQHVINVRRGEITIIDRQKLERLACECYTYLRKHFENLLPGVHSN